MSCAAATLLAAAATYYVSQSAGNDSWAGTSPAPDGTNGPWKTLSRASGPFAAGDRILLQCGDTWDEELRPKGSGTPASPITIGSFEAYHDTTGEVINVPVGGVAPGRVGK